MASGPIVNIRRDVDVSEFVKRVAFRNIDDSGCLQDKFYRYK
jgi:hypothetical protein